LSTSWLFVGAVSAAVVAVGGLVILVRKRHGHLQAIIVMLFTEVPHRSTTATCVNVDNLVLCCVTDR
jgi:hypothetical protein